MVLSPGDVDSIRRHVATGTHEDLRLGVATGITLGASLELVCAENTWAAGGESAGVQLVSALGLRLPLIQQARRALAGEDATLADGELCKIDRALVVDPAAPFFVRFQRALRIKGFTNKLDYGIARAFREMADNAVQHSGPTDEAPARGLLGYRVAERCVTFAVADIGRGVLASLQTNPSWRGLASTEDALLHAVCKNASRRSEFAQGNGFPDLHRALADLAGVLRFRSGNGSLTLDGRGHPRQATQKSSPSLPGFQLSITCSLDNTPQLL